MRTRSRFVRTSATLRIDYVEGMTDQMRRVPGLRSRRASRLRRIDDALKHFVDNQSDIGIPA